MGTTIKASAISKNGLLSSLELTVQAAQTCIEKSGIDKNDIDILINVGIYHDDNMMEPAMAPLILQQLEINSDPLKPESNFSFCFDLYNGACGFINAIQVADSAITSGQARHALIVSGDVHPSKTKDHNFPFTPVGAAILLTHSENQNSGFQNIYINTSDNDYHGLIGGVELSNYGENGRGAIDLYQERKFTDQLCEFIALSKVEYFEKHAVNPAEINYLITSQPEKGFSKHVHDVMGLNGTSKTVELYDQYGDAHTSALPLGYHQIVETGELKKNDTVLLVAAGSGLTSAFAMYTA